MYASTFTPKLVCLNSTHSSHFCKPSKPVSGFQVNFKAKSLFSNRFVSVRTYATLADPFVLEIADALQDSVSSLSLSSSPSPVPLQKIRDISADSLLSLKWPSKKDEAFRFTDKSFLRSSQIHPVANPPLDIGFTRSSEDAQLPNLVIVDGVFDGNIDVNRLAQQTDAGQLTRNLLLVPRATVNGKPNLTIEAYDVQSTRK